MSVSDIEWNGREDDVAGGTDRRIIGEWYSATGKVQDMVCSWEKS